ncbi:MAG: hypothetical protein WBR13_10235 [Allosphingosinicella sp.]
MDSETLRRNERLKGASGVLTNLGCALVAAAAARWFALRFDIIALVWLIAAAMIIWAGLNMLLSLQWELGGE